MRITFVNHASFIIDHDGVRLLCDPWLEGLAFDSGWSLLSPTRLRYDDLADVTHIWFSHEHPDHFSPPNLLKIAPEHRAKITVLFQETVDRKVAEFCRKAGFKELVELHQGRYHRLSMDLELRCDPYTEGDSFAVVRSSKATLLNLNDCVVDSPAKASSIARSVGPVDVLFTQFGYANKIGNVDDDELRHAASREKLERIRHQVKALRPGSVVPFASFVRFCHEENAYMNKGINPIDRVHHFIRNELNVGSVVLYPGDTWQVGYPHDATAAVRRYMEDLRASEGLPQVKGRSVEEHVLIEHSRSYVHRLRSGSPAHAHRIGAFSAAIHVTDLGGTYQLHGTTGLSRKAMEPAMCDIALTSSALDQCLLHLWGGDTLNVNARFQIPPGGDYARFRRFGAAAAMLNRGEDLDEMFPGVLERAGALFKRIVRERLARFS